MSMSTKVSKNENTIPLFGLTEKNIPIRFINRILASYQKLTDKYTSCWRFFKSIKM